jgi:hypothetical protein
MGTNSDAIESCLVRVTASKISVSFQILVSSFQKRYFFPKIFGNKCKLKTHFFLRQVLLRAMFGGSAFCVNYLQMCRC